VVEKAKHRIFYAADMLSESELPPGRDAIRFARAYGGENISAFVASDTLFGPNEVALVNGMRDETDDSQFAKIQLLADEEFRRLMPRRQSVVEIMLGRWNAVSRACRFGPRRRRESFLARL
jgi:hypothetical protein